MQILIACETSGELRRRFGAWSVDLLPADDGETQRHIQGDALDVIYGQQWDMLIAHPPCTYLCSSGLHWNSRVAGRDAQTAAALEFVRKILDAPIARICVENPVGRIGTGIRPADQYIQPYQFGDNASKRTGLWLKGLPLLVPTNRVHGRRVNGRERFDNQTDSGQNILGPSPDRWKVRSKTYGGIADAMVTQWS